MPRSMASIRTRDTAPERILHAALARLGTGDTTLNDPSLPGSPDVALHGPKVALFAHGCFWHHHDGCPHARIPQTSYPWKRKFACNQARDQAARAQLLATGWRVMWAWECGLLGRQALAEGDLDGRIQGLIQGRDRFVEIERLPLGASRRK